MPMDRLDQIVIDEVNARVLHPDRLSDLLEAYLKSANSRSSQAKEQLSRLRQAHKDAEAGVVRLLTLVEQGVMDAEDASLKERLVGLKVRRDELAAEMTGLQKRIASGEPTITPDKIAAFADLLRDKLRNGPPDLRQAYVRLVMGEVTVKDKEISISGSKAILARAATDGLDKAAPGVLSFVREWRAGKDSNPRPPDS